MHREHITLSMPNTQSYESINLMKNLAKNSTLWMPARNQSIDSSVTIMKLLCTVRILNILIAEQHVINIENSGLGTHTTLKAKQPIENTGTGNIAVTKHAKTGAEYILDIHNQQI